MGNPETKLSKYRMEYVTEIVRAAVMANGAKVGPDLKQVIEDATQYALESFELAWNGPAAADTTEADAGTINLPTPASELV